MAPRGTLEKIAPWLEIIVVKERLCYPLDLALVQMVLEYYC